MKGLILLSLLFFVSAGDNLKIYIFNVGQADSQLIYFPSGYSVLIDAGEVAGDTSATNAKYLAKRLKKILGKTTIDVLVLTHIHNDHHGRYKQGGIWYLIEKEGFTFKKFISRSVGAYKGSSFSKCSESTIDWKFIGQSSQNTVNFVCYATSSKDKTKLSKIREVANLCSTSQITPSDAGAEVQIIMRDAYGCKDSEGKLVNDCKYNAKGSPNENDFSICLRVVFGQFVYSTCGDLSGNQYEHNGYVYHDIESQIADMMGEVDVYHVNHHGSRSATNLKWSQTLKPTVSVFSCGENNKPGLPAATPLQNLNSVGSEMYFTNNCNSERTSKYGGKIHILNGDVVITVPPGGSIFKVAKPDGSAATKYNIKTNKAARSPCRKLAEGLEFVEDDSDLEEKEDDLILDNEFLDFDDEEDPELPDLGEDEIETDEDEESQGDDDGDDDDIIVEGEPEIAEKDDERTLFEEGYGEDEEEF